METIDAIASGDPSLATEAMQSHMGEIWHQIEHSARRDADSSTLTYSSLPLYP